MIPTTERKPPSPGTADNPMLIPSDDEENQRTEQEQRRRDHPPTLSSTATADIGTQCPPSWIELLKPRVRKSAGPSQEPHAGEREESETLRAVSPPDQDSDDEPLIGKRLKEKRSANDHGKEAAHSASTRTKRQRRDSGTPQETLSTPESASVKGPMTATSSPMSANTAVHNDLRVVVAPPVQRNETEIRCRGRMTFERARDFGGHGGNYVFQWPLGIGNPFFVIFCEPCRCSSKGKGYFWKHPFEGSVKIGLKHFGNHMDEWQRLEHSGWHVTDAHEHFEEMLHHNSTLIEKQLQR